MIRHIVFFTAARPEDRAAIVAGLAPLGTIAGVARFDVRENLKADLFGNAVDVVVYAEFADRAALDAYKRHPIYAEVTARVRPLRDQRWAADIEV